MRCQPLSRFLFILRRTLIFRRLVEPVRLVPQKYTLHIVFSWYENSQNVPENIPFGNIPRHLASNKGEEDVWHDVRSAKPESAFSYKPYRPSSRAAQVLITNRKQPTF